MGGSGLAGDKEEVKKSGGAGIEIQGKNKRLHEGFGVMQNAMTGTAASLGSEEDTGNRFYSPIDEVKGGNVLKQRTNIANASYQNMANMKKRSVNINSNSDFTGAGISHMPTKHIPQGMMGAKK